MLSNRPLTIEKREGGLWHAARITHNGVLLTRTTVLPREDEQPGDRGLAGAVGQSRMIGSLLARLSASTEVDGARRREYERAATATAKWLEQFPDQENPEMDLQNAITIEGKGRIVTPYPSRENPEVPALATAGRIVNFRSSSHESRTAPAVLEGWRRTGRPGNFVAVRLFERMGARPKGNWHERIEDEDAWYDVLVEWWRASHEKEMLHLHPGGIWALPTHFAGPAKPVRIG